VIDPRDDRDIRAITDLHLQLLPWGPMAGLGRLFLRRFCYTLLIRDGLMEAALFEVDGEPAGFIAYTTRSHTLHREALRRRPAAAALLLAGSVLADPAVLVRLARGARLLFSRSAEKRAGGDPRAEVLAIGVLPAYRTAAFARSAGLQVSRELVLHAARRFRDAGLTEMRMVVDAFNKPTLLFYHGLGGRFEQYTRAGDPMVQVRFDVDSLAGGSSS
jgi:ribosomal protein S18 acetylase RimI-like enzyme